MTGMLMSKHLGDGPRLRHDIAFSVKLGACLLRLYAYNWTTRLKLRSQAFLL